VFVVGVEIEVVVEFVSAIGVEVGFGVVVEFGVGVVDVIAFVVEVVGVVDGESDGVVVEHELCE
jgi:hypothetical protein